MKEPVNVLTPGLWYVDVETGARFKLVNVLDDSALEADDEHGERRLLSRWLWERDMRPVSREPVTAATEPTETTVTPRPTLRKVQPVNAPVLRTAVNDVRDQIDPMVTCEKCQQRVRERTTALVKGKRLCSTCM